MDDAVVMLFHPWAMKPAGPYEVDDLRILWELQADDVEVETPEPARMCAPLNAHVLDHVLQTANRPPTLSALHAATINSVVVKLLS